MIRTTSGRPNNRHSFNVSLAATAQSQPDSAGADLLAALVAVHLARARARQPCNTGYGDDDGCA